MTFIHFFEMHQSENHSIFPGKLCLETCLTEAFFFFFLNPLTCSFISKLIISYMNISGRLALHWKPIHVLMLFFSTITDLSHGLARKTWLFCSR